MAHDINIILDYTGELMGDATTGKLVEFQSAIIAADSYIVNLGTSSNETSDELHEILEEIQEFLDVGTEMASGAVVTIQDYTERINDII